MPYDPNRVLSQLDIRLKTPNPPGSSLSAWSPKTPSNMKQLNWQISSIKTMLKRGSRSPPTPTNIALTQLGKGCQLAMHGATMLARENRDLRAANEKQKQKRQRSKKQLSNLGDISIQEARELISRPNQAGEASNSTPQETNAITSQPRQRAPPRCSDCNTLGHRRIRCPNRVNA